MPAVGMDDYVTKPIDVDHLYKTLVKWIKPGKRKEAKDAFHKKIQAVERPLAETVLPDKINGIDMKAGLLRVGNNAKLYKELLISLKTKYAGIGDEIKTELEKDNYSTAGRKAHTIKGLAGNLGATELYDAAIALEEGILNDKTNDLDILIKTFEERLKFVMMGLSDIHDDDEGLEKNLKAESKNEFDPEKVQLLLAELKDLILSDIVSAADTLDSLEGYFTESDTNDIFKMLKEQVSSFDTKNALNTLSELTKITLQVKE